MTRLCLTIDVEDFYEGIAVLGHPTPRPANLVDRLDRLVGALGTEKSAPKITLFVIGRHASTIRPALAEFAGAGHEIASHGPDHGRLPSTDTATLVTPWVCPLNSRSIWPVRPSHSRAVLS